MVFGVLKADIAHHIPPEIHYDYLKKTFVYINFLGFRIDFAFKNDE